jgi:hypothetical protein
MVPQLEQPKLFQRISLMSTKTIYMRCFDSNGGAVDITQKYDDGCSWMAIAYQFHKFLSAQGYILDNEQVGADVEAFCMSIEE